jgi:hypothetical protein
MVKGARVATLARTFSQAGESSVRGASGGVAAARGGMGAATQSPAVVVAQGGGAADDPLQLFEPMMPIQGPQRALPSSSQRLACRWFRARTTGNNTTTRPRAAARQPEAISRSTPSGPARRWPSRSIKRQRSSARHRHPTGRGIQHHLGLGPEPHFAGRARRQRTADARGPRAPREAWPLRPGARSGGRGRRPPGRLL